MNFRIAKINFVADAGKHGLWKWVSKHVWDRVAKWYSSKFSYVLFQKATNEQLQNENAFFCAIFLRFTLKITTKEGIFFADCKKMLILCFLKQNRYFSELKSISQDIPNMLGHPALQAIFSCKYNNIDFWVVTIQIFINWK